MERAAKVVRRSGVKLLSLGGGHGDLNLVISEQKDVKNSAKAFMAAQNSAAQYMMKWASNEENRAIEDVSNQIVELNLLWTEAQREFTEQLKEFKHMFDLLLDGEKHVDQAKNNLMVCEQRETKIKKELKKAAKKASAEELRQLESRLIQAERQRDLAQLEVEDKIRENEAVKLIRFKEGMLKVSGAYTELGRKCGIIFEAQRNISQQIPDVLEKDIDDIKYTGSGTAKHYVLQAKEKVRRYKRQSQMQKSSLPLGCEAEPPPPYTPRDLYDESQPTVGARQDLPPEEMIDPHLHSNVLTSSALTSSSAQMSSRTSLPARTVTPPRLQQQQQPPARPPHPGGARPARPAVTTSAQHDDLNWGSEDEDDVTGAMGGLNL